MSDEENKAIEMLRNYDNEDNLHKIHQSINVVLNLIEKQQKEIEESEQKEKKAYIDGTNVAHELCNKYWEDKIKAKIGERMQKNNNIIHNAKLKYGKDYVYYLERWKYY